MKNKLSAVLLKKNTTNADTKNILAHVNKILSNFAYYIRNILELFTNKFTYSVCKKASL